MRLHRCILEPICKVLKMNFGQRVFYGLLSDTEGLKIVDRYTNIFESIRKCLCDDNEEISIYDDEIVVEHWSKRADRPYETPILEMLKDTNSIDRTEREMDSVVEGYINRYLELLLMIDN